ncbi:MAG: metallophosphoesterase family protein [Solirubrobacteraceae bacterium]|nr:metallophosphoesterase family protein [Solirubrobacteraceae bacterium]
MTTLVVSDLHLGRPGGDDVLQQPVARGALVARLRGVDRLVLLGDTLELRHGPAADALGRAERVLRELGGAMAGPGREIVVVPGNHDHELAADWHARRQRERAAPLGFEQRFGAEESSWVGERVAALLAPAQVRFAYPGLWLRDDVYATHGHYLDVHSTIPTFERLAAGLTARLAGQVDDPATPDDYERVLAPNYAWSGALAQRTRADRAAGSAGSGVRVYRILAGDGHRPLSHRALARLFPLAVLAVNRAGLGPVRADVRGPALRRAVLEAIGEAVLRLRLDTAHVVFGHSHRAGPLPDDDQAEWRVPGTETSLHNTGSWVYEGHFIHGPDGVSPYWAGNAVIVDEAGSGPPRLERLLSDVPRAALRPAGLSRAD